MHASQALHLHENRCGSISVVGVVFAAMLAWIPSPAQAQAQQGRPAQIDGPVARPPVQPQVRLEDLDVSAKRHPAPQWRSGDPVVIIEDLRERPQPDKAAG